MNYKLYILDKKIQFTVIFVLGSTHLENFSHHLISVTEPVTAAIFITGRLIRYGEFQLTSYTKIDH